GGNRPGSERQQLELGMARGVLGRFGVRISRRSRAAKFEQMLKSLPTPSASLLAVGVEADGGSGSGGFDTGNQIELALLQAGYRLTMVSYDNDVPKSLVDLGALPVRGDGRSLPFRGEAFDVVLSNAVIEHVGGPSSAARFIEESRRVARSRVIHTSP